MGYAVERKKAYDALRRVYISFLVNGGYRVELVEPDGENSPLYPLLKRYKNTPYHICYTAKDVAQAGKILTENGYAVLQDIQEAPCIDNRNVIFLTNPDMGIVELVEDGGGQRNNL